MSIQYKVNFVLKISQRFSHHFYIFFSANRTIDLINWKAWLTSFYWHALILLGNNNKKQMNIPEGFIALLSPGTVFLLTEIPTSSRILSALEPLSLILRKSTKTMWLSVPSVTILYPKSLRFSQRAWAFVTTVSWYVLET